MCAMNGIDLAFVQNVEAYALRCQQQGIDICDWRKQIDSRKFISLFSFHIYLMYNSMAMSS